MGNAIAKKFDVPKDHTSSAGHHQFWKIWPGRSKETGELVSVWAFDKADLTKRKVNPIHDKATLEQIFQIMKKDFMLIKESLLCSSVVRYIETVEESKTAIVFTTERIVCSLADIVNHFQGIEGGFSSHEDFFEDYGAVSEMEISKGLLSLAEGLQYLHNVQRKLHLNITPESVVISGNGQWKLCGFGFNLTFIQGDQQRLASPYFLKASPISHGVRLEPDLRYSGPECTDGGFNPPGIRYLTPASDLFSLGLLAYEMYRYNLKDIPERNSHRCVLTLTNNDVLQHHFALDALKALDFSFLPSGVSQLVIGLLQLNVMVRLTTADIINNQYFVSGSLAVLNMIEHMHSRDVGTQSSQLISLQGQLGSFSSRILYLNVLPSICKLCLVNSALWVYAMPLHVFISQQVSKERFKQYAGPTMANGLAVTTPTETQQAFLNNIQFIAGMFDREYFQANIVVLFCNALEKQNIFLQTLAFEKLAEDNIRALFDSESLAERLMPKLCKEACKNPEPNIKIQALYILSLFSKQLSAEFIAKSVLPSLKYITDSEKNASVSMCVVGNYEALSESLGPEYIASAILPSIQPMLVDKALDRQQFEVVVNLIKTLLKKLFDARTTELGLPPVSMGDMLSHTVVDPFAAAKALIAVSKRNSAAVAAGNNPASGPAYSSFSTTLTPSVVGGGSNGPPPPLPSSKPPTQAPPPPPSMPAPALPSTGPPGSVSYSSTPSTNGGGLFGIVGITSTSPISAYQSDFGKSNNTPSYVPTSSTPSYKSPFDAATGGVSSVVEAGINPFAASSSSFVSTPSVPPPAPVATTPAAASSSFGWFSSSKPAASKPNDVYQPPAAPLISTSSTNASVSSMSGGGPDDMDDFLSSFNKKTPAPMGGGLGGPGAHNPPLPSKSAFPSATSSGPLHIGSSQLSIEEQIQQTQAQIAKLSATTASTIASPTYGAVPITPMYGNGSMSAQTAPPMGFPSTMGSTAAASSGMYGGNSNSFPPTASSGMSFPAPTATPFSGAPLQPQPTNSGYQQTSQFQQQPVVQQQYGAAAQQQQYGAPQSQFGTPQYGNGMQASQPQQPQQQGFGLGGTSSSGGGFGAAPIASSGYSSQSYNAHLQAQQPQYGNGNNGGVYGQQPPPQQQQPSRIGTLPPVTGYQPPAAYSAPPPGQYQQQQQQQYQQPQQQMYGQQMGQMGQQQQQQYRQPQQQQMQPLTQPNKGNASSSAFDFLN